VLTKALNAARLPAHVRVEVRDAELATALRRRVEFAEVHFDVVPRLDAVDFMMSQMTRDMMPPIAPPLLDQPGMSIERLAAFADGCAMFYAARPWRHLMDDDLIESESPTPPQGFRLASILGAGGQVCGIAF